MTSLYYGIINLISIGVVWVIGAAISLSYLAHCGIRPAREVSDSNSSLFTPVTPTYAIWIVIFVYQTFWRAWAIGRWSATGYAFSVNIGHGTVAMDLLLCLWMVVYGIEWLETSVIVHAIVLFMSAWCYFKSNVGYLASTFDTAAETTWVYYVPWSLTLGWVLISFISNMFVYLMYKDQVEEGRAAKLHFYITALIICWFVYFRNDMAIPLVGLIGYTGIFLRNFHVSSVVFGASVATVVVSVMSVIRLVYIVTL
jgi:hypothetical protein